MKTFNSLGYDLKVTFFRMSSNVKRKFLCDLYNNGNEHSFIT